MNVLRPSLLVLALAAAFPAMAQSNEELLKELQALKARIGQLEAKLGATPAPAAPATQPQWGMTPEQAAEFNRIAAKTEAIQDNLQDKGFMGLKISGYIEPTYVWNQRQNRAGFQFLNQQSDGYAYDTSYFGAASIDFLKETDSGTIWHLTLAPNRGVGAAIDGASIVQEASVSVALTDQNTRFIAGQIPDWSGYEYQQPTLNPLTSHNLLYDFTLPVGYTGAGLDLKDGKWWVRTAIANLNAPVHQAGDKSAVWALRLDYAKGEYDGWGFASVVGKTPNFNTGTNTMSFIAEADGYFTRGDLTLQGQLAYGQQKEGAITPAADGSWRDSRWFGASGLVGFMFTPRLQGLVRADYIYNRKNGGGLFGYNGYSGADENGDLAYGNDGRNGLGPDLSGDLDKGANRYAVTIGGKYAVDTATTVKLEYRLDGADRPVFEDVRNGTFKKTNNMIATSVVVAF
ncbi:DUF3138 family protein [Ideonella azotifigens]|uniref:DUF3138 family protein n=1 Tax=Ideonella azotifigens TaxID=513160 RepID=A0ABN1K8I6_9BURK|nr:DUF3138 family protein [Ideonella azotifigens]MCD2342861.1 DUF3138 family protein [Ideonella azotifigens]